MIKIAITGPSGSGKSTFLGILASQGYPVIDCDKVAHQLQNPGEKCYFDIIEAFGKDILYDDETINRKMLAKKAFADKESTVKLNSITHRHIIERVNQLCDEYGKKGNECVFIEAGALFESGLDQQCKRIILITASVDKLIQRICDRDRIEEDAAQMRLHAQKDISFLINNSHLVLYNNYEESLLSMFTNLVISKIKEWSNGNEY